MPGNFFDSNVILYLASSDGAKVSRVEELLAERGSISVQVLNECANVLRRKHNMLWPALRAFLLELREGLDVLPVMIDIHEAGLRLAQRYGFAVYDAMIVAAALSAECDTLWSEDMQDGLIVEKRLRIANPFGSALTPP
jgi:predicted nucleic acid-binding protein